MGTHISLKEAAAILKSGDDPRVIVDHPDLAQFISDVEDMGIEVLSDKDTEYLANAVTMLAGAVMGGVMGNASEDGDFATLLKVLSLVDDPIYLKIITLAFKYSVGLATLEELR